MIEFEYLEHIGFYKSDDDDVEGSILFMYDNPTNFRHIRYYPKERKYCLVGSINMLPFDQLFYWHADVFDRKDFKLFKRSRTIKKILK